LAHPAEVNRGIADTLIQQNDLAQRPDRVAIKAHAAAVSLWRRVVPLRFAGPANVSETLR